MRKFEKIFFVFINLLAYTRDFVRVKNGWYLNYFSKIKVSWLLLKSPAVSEISRNKQTENHFNTSLLRVSRCRVNNHVNVVKSCYLS